MNTVHNIVQTPSPAWGDLLRADTNGKRDSVDRVLAILGAFALVKPTWRVSELAKQLGMPKSTVSTILRSTTRLGFTEVAPSGVYRLGFQFYKLAVSALGRYGVRKLVREIMERTVRECGETVYLCLYHDRELIFFERVDGPNPIRYHPELAGSFHLHAGAAGKAVLAFLDAATIDRILSGPLERVTSKTLVDPEALKADLEKTRARGYAVSVGERVEGAAAVAAPVISQDGRVLGSLVISLPATRFNEERAQELGRLAREAAGEVARIWDSTGTDG